MSEIKTKIKQNPDGNFTITDAHSTADIVRWLLTQDSKETILYLLGVAPQRTWVGLTESDRRLINFEWQDGNGTATEIIDLVEAKLKEKNT